MRHRLQCTTLSPFLCTQYSIAPFVVLVTICSWVLPCLQARFCLMTMSEVVTHSLPNPPLQESIHSNVLTTSSKMAWSTFTCLSGANVVHDPSFHPNILRDLIPSSPQCLYSNHLVLNKRQFVWPRYQREYWYWWLDVVPQLTGVILCCIQHSASGHLQNGNQDITM